METSVDEARELDGGVGLPCDDALDALSKSSSESCVALRMGVERASGSTRLVWARAGTGSASAAAVVSHAPCTGAPKYVRCRAAVVDGVFASDVAAGEAGTVLLGFLTVEFCAGEKCFRAGRATFVSGTNLFITRALTPSCANELVLHRTRARTSSFDSVSTSTSAAISNSRCVPVFWSNKQHCYHDTPVPGCEAQRRPPAGSADA